jgi:hypothetical protein
MSGKPSSISKYIRFGVLTTVAMKNFIFWDIPQCRPVDF